MKQKRVIPFPSWLCEPETQKLLACIPDSSHTIRFVGGCVRDTLLNKPVTDLDLATPFKPPEILRFLQDAHIKTVPLGLEHGSILAVIGARHYEMTTLRRDVKTDGRHADVTFTDDWQEDARRRDFTFNALYLSPASELYDPWDGEGDLYKGIVRFIGNPEERIQEDYLRILRYFRFYAYYGRETPDKATLEACKKLAPGIEKLSAERIRVEILKLLKASDPLVSVEKMNETGVWHYALKGVPVPDQKALKNLMKLEQEFHVAPDALRRLCVALKSDAQAIQTVLNELKFSNKEKNKVTVMREASDALSPKSTEQMLYDYGLEATRDILLIQATQGHTSLVPGTLPSSWNRPEFPLSGDDLQALGLVPSPLLGKILKEVEKWWIERHFIPRKAECLEKAKETIALLSG